MYSRTEIYFDGRETMWEPEVGWRVDGGVAAVAVQARRWQAAQARVWLSL